MIELAESASFYVSRPSFPLSNGKAQRLLEGDGPAFLAATVPVLAVLEPWAHDALEDAMRRMAEQRGLGLGKVAQPLRAALTGSNVSRSEEPTSELQSLMRISYAVFCLN